MRLFIYQNELNAICFDKYFSCLNSIKNIIDKPIYDFLKTPKLSRRPSRANYDNFFHSPSEYKKGLRKRVKISSFKSLLTINVFK